MFLNSSRSTRKVDTVWRRDSSSLSNLEPAVLDFLCPFAETSKSDAVKKMAKEHLLAENDFIIAWFFLGYVLAII